MPRPSGGNYLTRPRAIFARLILLDAVFLHLQLQVSPADPQIDRRQISPAAVLFQGAFDRPFLDLLEAVRRKPAVQLFAAAFFATLASKLKGGEVGMAVVVIFGICFVVAAFLLIKQAVSVNMDVYYRGEGLSVRLVKD